MIIIFNNTTRKVKKDNNNNLYVKYDNEKYVLTNILEHTTVLQNEKWQNDKILAVIYSE